MSSDPSSAALLLHDLGTLGLRLISKMKNSIKISSKVSLSEFQKQTEENKVKREGSPKVFSKVCSLKE